VTQPILTRKQVLSLGKARLLDAGLRLDQREIEWLFMEASSCTKVDLTAYPEAEVSVAEQHRFDQMLGRRLSGEPVQYILGYTDFMGLRIAVRPGVLIPRPETEGLVLKAAEKIKGVSNPVVVDVGTGSGCIALTIKSRFPGARVLALDISDEALDIARSNAQSLGLDVSLIQSDLNDAMILDDLRSGVDLIVSNPPYIPENDIVGMDRIVTDYEPAGALFAGPEGLDAYDPLGKMGIRLLKPAGWIMVETHAEHGASVRRIFERNCYSGVMVAKDLAGRDRYVIGQKGPGH